MMFQETWKPRLPGWRYGYAYHSGNDIQKNNIMSTYHSDNLSIYSDSDMMIFKKEYA